MVPIIVVGDPTLDDQFIRLRKLTNDKHYGIVSFVETFNGLEKHIRSDAPNLFIVCGVPIVYSKDSYVIGDIAVLIKEGNAHHQVMEFRVLNSFDKNVDWFIPHHHLGQGYEEHEAMLRELFPGICVSDLGAAFIAEKIGSFQESSPQAFVAHMQKEHSMALR